MTAFVDSTLRDIEGRLRDLKDEVSRLEAARAALAGNGRAPASRRGRRPGRPPRARTASPRTASPRTSTATAPQQQAGRRPRRSGGRRGGTRASQALELVRNRPGITIPDLASAMKISPNYLYRVMPKLATEGQVKRDGQGWHPAS